MNRPLVELHVHLDGSLRIPTMLDIAREEGVVLPAKDEAGLCKVLRCGQIRAGLPQYLEHFAITTSVMQSRKALTRIAKEFIEDSAAEGILWTEPRFMPSLHTRGGLSEEEVMEAVLDGLRLGGMERSVGWRLIVCSMTHVSPDETGRMTDLAIGYRKYGVAAIDMAGDDTLDDSAHIPHFRRALENGVNVVKHASESDGPECALRAIRDFGAKRLGHALRAAEDPEVVEEIWRHGVGIEACLTSNLQIGKAASYAGHSARGYHRKGMLVSLNCDNRMLADTTLTKELELARHHWELDELGVQRLVWNAIQMSFAPPQVKDNLHRLLRTA